MNNNINEKLRLLKNEDLIWVVYIFIAIAALFSNYYEKNTILFKNKNAYKKYKTINVCILTIAFFIYLYFVLIIYKNIDEMKNDFKKNQQNIFKLIGALLFLVGGLIYLLVELQSGELDEIAII